MATEELHLATPPGELSRDEAGVLVEILRRDLRRNDHRYDVPAGSEVPDARYDRMYRRLRRRREAGARLERARKLGVALLDEPGFAEWLDEHELEPGRSR